MVARGRELVPMRLVRERSPHRDGKATGVIREVQTGDAAFDEAVFVETSGRRCPRASWSESTQRATAYLDTSDQMEMPYALSDAGPFAPVGQNLTIGKGFVGLLDELKLYDRVLTKDEIRSIAR